MSTLSIHEYEIVMREADRFREIIKVEIGQTYFNRICLPVTIVGEVEVPGWRRPFFVDSDGDRYDKFGCSYGKGILPPSNEDLVSLDK